MRMEDPIVWVTQNAVAWVRMKSREKASSKSPFLSLYFFHRCTSQASRATGESFSPWVRVCPSSMWTATWEA